MKPIHRKRLKRLAEYLLTQVPEEQFDMGKYRWHKNSDQICGTAGCALGWSPAIMNKRTFQKYKYKNGRQGVDTLFETISKKYFGMDTSTEWYYLFSGTWACADNTPQGAAARILYLLDHGVPDCFNGGGNPWEWDTSHYQHYLTDKKSEVN